MNILLLEYKQYGWLLFGEIIINFFLNYLWSCRLVVKKKKFFIKTEL